MCWLTELHISTPGGLFGFDAGAGSRGPARAVEYSTSEVLDEGQTFSNPLDLTKNTLNRGDSTDAH